MTDALKKGDTIAWVMKSPTGKTTGLSKQHRVYENGRTYCSTVIPGAQHHLPADLLKLPVCGRCDAMAGRGMAYEAKELARASA
jgi:hypothetical protein